MPVGGVSQAAVGLAPPLDAAALTRAVAGAATRATDVAVDLVRAGSAPAAPSGGEALPAPTAEEIAAVQQALGLANAVAGRSGASSLA